MKPIFDALYLDTLDFSVPATALSMGHALPTMDAVYRALCESVGLELIDYASAMRIPVGDRVLIQIRGGQWVRRETS